MTRKLDPKPRMRPARFVHFVLRTRDLDRSVAWYQTVVGMDVVHRAEKIAFLTYDEEHHRLALVETPQQEAAPAGAAGLDHVAYAFETLGELLENYRRLEAEGIKPFWSINHGPTTSMYYADPDGNGVEFQFDNFETAEDLQGFMRSDTFRANPIGVPFDPDKLIARYERGDAIAELVQQGAA